MLEEYIDQFFFTYAHDDNGYIEMGTFSEYVGVNKDTPFASKENQNEAVSSFKKKHRVGKKDSIVMPTYCRRIEYPLYEASRVIKKKDMTHNGTYA